MRRLLSISLLFALLLPLFPAVAAAESAVPACCRRDGKHHCMMGVAAVMGAASDERRVQAPRMMCPYQQRTVAATHHESAAPGTPLQPIVSVHYELSSLSQVECLRRISFDRSRQKRGPPVHTSLTV